MNDICRLCGNHDQNLVNIFESNKKFPHLYSRICINLQIKISVADELSHYICPSCFVKLGEFDEFIKQCQKTQFILLGVDDTDLSPLKEQIFSTDVISVSLHEDSRILDGSYDSINDLVEENENEIPFKRRKLSSEFQNDDTVAEEHQEIEINLDDYYENGASDENTSDDSNRNLASEKLPLSKLVSYFSSRVQVNKSDSIGEEVEINIDTVDPEIDYDIAKIKHEIIESENSSNENDSLNDNLNKIYIKKEDEKVLFKDIIETSKLKPSNLKTCPLCAHKFAPNELEEHIRFHSDNEEYLDLIIAEMKEVPFKHKNHYCEDCKKVFIRDSLYLEHQNNHLKIKMINCHLCDNKFSIRKKLKVHLRAVHIPKNNKCDFCSYAAKTYPDLQKHVKGVHEFQPIICEICGKSVSSNVSNYNRHLQTHSEEKPYKCELCDSSFKTAASLQKHRNNIHFPESVMCTACGTICKSKIKYKKHVRRCRRRIQRYC